MAVKSLLDLSLDLKSAVRKKFSIQESKSHSPVSDTKIITTQKLSFSTPHDLVSNSIEEIEPMSLTLQYLGFAELKAPGLPEICVKVNNMYLAAKPSLKTFDKTQVTLSRAGITLKQNNENEYIYKPRRIIYCGVDKQHQRVFSFNYQYGLRAENIHLHVLVCKTKEDARMIAKYLGQVFKIISKDEHEKDKKDKQMHSEGLTKFKTRSTQNINHNTNNYYPKSQIKDGSASKENSCEKGACGSDSEWSPGEQLMPQLPVA
ncbi:low density lipoprotein receptor adapter protein 1 [Hydra vulgaris]|uniref:low density lipoprotein receptor adapter protein 1 n=1 Tax=Hydra vulgaris TaxID=6087 RepID=UPI0001925BDF|nr:low density lipoprotein receptor adapter protein 1 [Hydra vulgaris]